MKLLDTECLLVVYALISISLSKRTSSTIRAKCGTWADDYTQINWDSVGKSYRFICPSTCPEDLVRGCQEYGTDSDICTTAKHAGVKGGERFWIVVGESKSFRNCTRYGIQSKPYNKRGPFYSFTILGGDTGLSYYGVGNYCGKKRFRAKKRRIVKRIMGGLRTRPNEWPWLVYLNGPQVCGGTLIHPQWIITAAHCVVDTRRRPHANESLWTAIVGEHQLDEMEGVEREMKIEQIVSHPPGLQTRRRRAQSGAIVINTSRDPEVFCRKYNKGLQYDNDIALMKLETPVGLTRYINIACLPPPKGNLFKHGTKCYVAGWGDLDLNGNEAEFTRHVKLSLVSNRICNEKLNERVPENWMCAWTPEGGKDPCVGDSGGPLMCRKDSQWLLAGIVSHGYGCGNKGYPGLYMRVSNYTKWIQRTITRNQ